MERTTQKEQGVNAQGSHKDEKFGFHYPWW